MAESDKWITEHMPKGLTNKMIIATGLGVTKNLSAIDESHKH
jgi:hypothetical protein